MTTSKKKDNIISQSEIESLILTIRSHQVLIDRDLAVLYGVETKRLNEQVKRNKERFPVDFCFQLNEFEFENWRSQFATSNSDKMGVRRAPYAFTEQGVAMLASVLKSETAILASVKIMRAFVAMRRFLIQNANILLRIANLDHCFLSTNRKAVLSKCPRKYTQIFSFRHNKYYSYWTGLNSQK